MKKVVLLVLSAVTVAAILFARNGGDRHPGDPESISVSGNIEVRDAEISFKIAGRVIERHVSEGEAVVAGQVLARMESAELSHEVTLRKAELRLRQASLDELEAGFRPEEIAQASAAVDKAQARLNELVAGARPEEIAAAEAFLRSVLVTADHLKVELDRQARLLKSDTIAQREYDRTRSEYETAMARMEEARKRLELVRAGSRLEQIDAARAAVSEARERHALLLKGPREETIEQSRARVEQARAGIAMAETRLSYATLRSPLSGIVLSENIEPGEYVSPGTPVVTIGDLENVWLRAYIDESDLGRVKAGQLVRVSIDTYPGKVYEGRLSFISSAAEFTPKNVQTEKERVKLVYRVKIDIPNPDMELKAGMPADAEIVLGPRAER